MQLRWASAPQEAVRLSVSAPSLRGMGEYVGEPARREDSSTQPPKSPAAKEATAR